MDEKLVITINRQYGSGGLKIGKRLAEELGITCYDSEMFRVVSSNSNMHKDSIAGDSIISGTMLFDVAKNIYDEHPDEELPDLNGNFVGMENLFQYQTDIIKELAKRESCVIVGRCSNYILHDRPNTLSVFIHASLEYRLKRASSVHNMDREELTRLLFSKDNHKEEYYKHYTGVEWKDASFYDLSIDSGKLGISGSVKEIVDYIKMKYGNLIEK